MSTESSGARRRGGLSPRASEPVARAITGARAGSNCRFWVVPGGREPKPLRVKALVPGSKHVLSSLWQGRRSEPAVCFQNRSGRILWGGGTEGGPHRRGEPKHRSQATRGVTAHPVRGAIYRRQTGAVKSDGRCAGDGLPSKGAISRRQVGAVTPGRSSGDLAHVGNLPGTVLMCVHGEL